MKENTKKLYPSLNDELLKGIFNALCPFNVKLPAALEKEISKTCTDFLSLKKEASEQTGNEWEDSILNSLDFHYSDKKLKIIEANTNASGYMVSHLCNQPSEDIKVFEEELFKSFEVKFGKGFKKIFIIDADPEAEKMFAEFLMYKDFFKRMGVEAVVLKTAEFKAHLKSHLTEKTCVYNRDTDFYFEHHPELLKAWKDGKLILTSSPLSYDRIAAKAVKQEETDLLETEKYSDLKSHFLETLNFTPDLWPVRKGYFFKPASSFGSKGVYSGKSISRKKFDGLGEGQDYLAQELHPPGKVTHGETEWKYDIRAYFSEGSAQKVLARVYNGQLTNFSQAGGGFALIDWIV